MTHFYTGTERQLEKAKKKKKFCTLRPQSKNCFQFQSMKMQNPKKVLKHMRCKFFLALTPQELVTYSIVEQSIIIMMAARIKYRKVTHSLLLILKSQNNRVKSILKFLHTSFDRQFLDYYCDLSAKSRNTYTVSKFLVNTKIWIS